MHTIRLGRVLAILLVLGSYFGSIALYMNWTDFTVEPHSHYNLLTKGFLSGHLNLAASPSPALLSLPDPYEPILNKALRLHDASLYHGKYYIYFGPLPVLIFFMPFKLMTGYYAPDWLAVLLLVSAGFLLNFFLLVAIRDRYFQAIREWQFNFVVVMLGLADNSMWLIYSSNLYEVAIASAYCFMSGAILFLFHFFQNPNKLRTVFLFSSCLALTVACRPHFALACTVILLPGFYIVKYVARARRNVCLLALILPMITVASLLMIYNFQRFDSVFEFGHAYQLGVANYRQLKMITSPFYVEMPFQFYSYFLAPYIYLMPPHVPVNLQKWLTGGTLESTIGALTTVPWVTLVVMAPWLYRHKFRRMLPDLQGMWWFLGCLSFIWLLILGFLLVINTTAQRYESDYLPLLMICSIVILWILQTRIQLPSLLLQFARPLMVMTGLLGIMAAQLSSLRASFPGVDKLCSILSLDLFLFLPALIALIYFIIRTMQPAVVSAASPVAGPSLNIGNCI